MLDNINDLDAYPDIESPEFMLVEAVDRFLAQASLQQLLDVVAAAVNSNDNVG